MISKKVNGIPASEDIWTTYIAISGETYYISAKRNKRDMYYIYKMTDGKAVKLGKHKNPNVLTEQYIK